MLRTAAFVLAMLSGVATVSAADVPSPSATYTQQIEQWRAARVARLTAPTGWLSLIGLEWLNEGANRVGSAADNVIVLKAGPAHLGTVTLAPDGGLHLALDPASGATVDGKAVTEAALVDDMHAAADAEPTTDAESRRHFLGIDYFPIDDAWRIEADWVPFTPPHDLAMGSVIGTIDTVKVPGKAVFRRDGHTFELLPYQEEPGGELFFVLADRTSGKETYGAARFLYAALPAGGLDHPGKVVLDFNKAYNPPCAFTSFATCPLAPPENRLDVAITAGEKKYRGGH